MTSTMQGQGSGISEPILPRIYRNAWTNHGYKLQHQFVNCGTTQSFTIQAKQQVHGR
jgi:hypothetical protein